MPKMNPFTWLRRKSKQENNASSATTPPPYEGASEASTSAPTTPTTAKRSSLCRPSLISRLSHSFIAGDNQTPLSPTTTEPIRATDVPQWVWSNAQCRAWLAAVLQAYLNYTREAATSAAMKLEGHGPTLYQRTSTEWERLLGEYNGKGIYIMILGMRYYPGAVPRNIELGHGGKGEGFKS